MPRILVTGSSGFIGRHIGARLAEGNAFTVLGAARMPAPGVDLCCDLTSPEQTRSLLRRAAPDAIVHAAGIRHGTVADLVAANIATTRNLLMSAACMGGRPRILLLGSAAEYGPQVGGQRIGEQVPCLPESAYGRTRLAATRLGRWYATKHGFDVTTLRLFNVVGPGMGGLPGDVVAHMAGHTGRLDWDHDRVSLPMVRDFVDVADVAEACLRALSASALPPAINICTGVGRSFAALIDEMSSIAGLDLVRPVHEGPADAAIGEPTLCETHLGFVPGADLGPALAAAIAEGSASR